MQKKANIFYLEDDAYIISNWVGMLEMKGYTLTCTTKVKQALVLFDGALQRSEIFHRFILDIIITPWEPFGDEETLYGFLTGLRVADNIIANYGKVYEDYKIIFNTAALGVGGEVAKRVQRYVEEHNDRCILLPKPLSTEGLLKELKI